MRFIQAAWARIKKVLHFIGRIQTAIVITFFYWLIVGPISLLLRLAGKKLIPRGRDPHLPTYWLEKKPASCSFEESLKRPF